MAENIQPLEKALLLGIWDSQQNHNDLQPAADLVKFVVDGNFRAALLSSPAQTLFSNAQATDFTQSFSEILKFSLAVGENELQQELLHLTLAVACLHAFVQANWTGPDLDVEPLEIFTIKKGESISVSQGLLDSKAISELAYGGEPAYHLAKVPAFLRISQVLLTLPYKHLWSASWWRLRGALVHQKVLDEPVGAYQDILASTGSLSSQLGGDPHLVGRLYLETGLLEHHFSRDKSAAEYFVKAARETGLRYELTGALGKRTKFQENELSQLVLLAESHLDDNTDDPKNGSGNYVQSEPIPVTLALNDEILLEQTQFTTSHPTSPNSPLSHINPSAQPPLHPLDQCILLSLCLNVRNTSPSHGLTNEQMAPYISRVITHPRNWSVHTMALLLRSRLESSRTRTVERSTLQLQALIDQMPTADSTLSERLLYFHSIPLPSKWEMEKELATRYLSIGVVKSALEIFERLEMWEDAVKCWGALERPEKGIAIVRDLLEGQKTEAEAIQSHGKTVSADRRAVQDSFREAKLWCLLGDLEPEHAEDHYQHAWTVSNETSGRAMRSLGGYYFARAKYPEAIACLNRAVTINPLLSRSWFILGCACMREENWQEAKNAFSRCVAIDEEDGESWNNLASMYLRMGTKRTEAVKGDNSHDGTRGNEISMDYSSDVADAIPFTNKLLAFRALKQGLRYSYNNWRMWYNYMIVAMDVGVLFEASRALRRVVDETGDKAGASAVDEDVLERLVNAVTRASIDEEKMGDEPGGTTLPDDGHALTKVVSGLFEETILPRMSTYRIFRAYGRLLTWQSRWEDAIKAHLDAYRCSAAGTMQKGETDVTRWREAVNEVGEIVDILRNFGPRVEGYKWRLQGQSIVRTFIGRTRDFEDEPEWERLIELQDDLRKE